MAISLDTYLAGRPEDERLAVAARASELIQEEATLRELRLARKRSQEQIAARMGVEQAAVSRLERRTDMHISNLRRLIEAMGGELDIVARFPDRPPVRIKQFATLDDVTSTGE